MQLRGLIAGLIGLVLASAAAADVDLPGNTVSIVIPYRPGGGFDRTVRVFAPYFAKQLGRDVRVLPRNVPGGGGRRGATMVYRARPDGLTFGIMNLPGFVLPSILGEQTNYDLLDLSWIGRLESQHYALVVAAGSSMHSIDDLQGEQTIIFLSTGYGSSVMAASQIAAYALGLMDQDPIFLAGYTGTADYLVALMRGDGNVALAPVSEAASYIEAGQVRALAVSGETSELTNVPTFAELGLPELTPLGVQRSLAAPPGMAPELLATIREAFARAVADPAFVAAAAKARLELTPLDGPRAAAEVAASFGFYERFQANLRNPNRF